MNKHNLRKKQNLKLAYLILLVFFIIFLNFNFVNAIGITPGRTTLDFQPNLEQTITLRVLNNELKSMRVELAVTGELAPYVRLNENFLEFNEYESEKEFSYTIDLPSTLDKPGEHTAKIVALEVPKKEVKETQELTSQVLSVVGVASQLYIKVPYPSSYLEANIQVNEATSLNENTTFILQLNNLGQENTKAVINVEIFKGNKLVSKLKTEEREVNAQQGIEFITGWQTNEPDKYTVRITINYSGKEIVLQKLFRIGELELALKRIYVEDYKLEQIAKVSIVVENKWSEQLKNVYGHLIIMNSKGDILAEFKSASSDLDPGALETIYAYWDTKGIKEESYTGKIIMYYNEESFERELKTRVGKESIDFEIVGITAEVIAHKEKSFIGSNINTLLIVIIVVLVLANVLWFVHFKNKLRRKKDG